MLITATRDLLKNTNQIMSVFCSNLSVGSLPTRNKSQDPYREGPRRPESPQCTAPSLPVLILCPLLFLFWLRLHHTPSSACLQASGPLASSARNALPVDIRADSPAFSQHGQVPLTKPLGPPTSSPDRFSLALVTTTYLFLGVLTVHP